MVTGDHTWMVHPAPHVGEGIMNIKERSIDDVVILELLGDITMNETGTTSISDRVRRLLLGGPDHFVLDMGHVRYVDSAGLGDLIQAFAAARNRGGALKLLNVTKRLNDLLILTRLLTVFECFDSEADALASFKMHAVAAR
jgi:anti-sigma B factor antagonist